MKTINIPCGEGFKRLDSLIKYQIDNFQDFELKEIKIMARDLKTDSSLTEEEKEEQRKEIREVLNIIDNFTSLVKRIQEGVELEITEGELEAFKDCVSRQLELSQARLTDFREDRFGWGKDACKVLEDDELIFYNEMTKFYNSLG